MQTPGSNAKKNFMILTHVLLGKSCWPEVSVRSRSIDQSAGDGGESKKTGVAHGAETNSWKCRPVGNAHRIVFGQGAEIRGFSCRVLALRTVFVSDISGAGKSCHASLKEMQECMREPLPRQ